MTPSHYRGWLRTQRLDVADASHLDRYLSELNSPGHVKAWLRDAIERELYRLPNACHAHAQGEAMSENETTNEPQPEAPAPAIAEPDFQEVGSPEQITALYFALAEARGDFTPISKNRTSGKGTNKEFRYADLDASLDATVPALRRHGLVLIQPLSMVAGKAKLRTTIAHKEGGRLYAFFDVPLPVSGDVQDFGKNVTYARRYCFNAALCLAADQDLDDRPGTGPEESPRSKPQVPPAEKRQEAPAAPRPTSQPSARPAAASASSPATRPTGNASPADTSSDGPLTAEEKDTIRKLLIGAGAATAPEQQKLSKELMAPYHETVIDRSNYKRMCIELGRLAITEKERPNV